MTYFAQEAKKKKKIFHFFLCNNYYNSRDLFNDVTSIDIVRNV